MKVAIILLTFSLLLMQCSPEGRSRDFFVKTKAYPDFSGVENGMRLWGLDSLAVDSLSTSINGVDYWYMSSAADGLINIQGYIRKQGRQITIKAGDRKKAKEEKEQLLFDFAYDSSQNRIVEYERNSTGYSLYIAQQLQHYREQEKDSVIIFRLIREVGGTSISTRLLMQTSLKNGFVSFLYLHAPGGQIYTIDLLPAPNARKDSLLVLFTLLCSRKLIAACMATNSKMNDMKERVEFRINCDFAHLLFGADEGKDVGTSVKVIELSKDDPRYSQIPIVAKEVNAKYNRGFYFGWQIKRKYYNGPLKKSR